MALAISTNFAINANTALNAMNKSQSLMGKSISRISTGNRAANPADDPLSYFSGNKIKGDTDGYQALYNGIQDGAARLNVADTALSSIIDVLTEMKSKAIAYDAAKDDADAQDSIQKAYTQLYNSLATFEGTKYKGTDVWSSSDLEFTTTLGGTADPEEKEDSITLADSVSVTSTTTNDGTSGGTSVSLEDDKSEGTVTVSGTVYNLTSDSITESDELSKFDPALNSSEYKKVTNNGGSLVGAWKESGGTVTFKNLKEGSITLADSVNVTATTTYDGTSDGTSVSLKDDKSEGTVTVSETVYNLTSDSITESDELSKFDPALNSGEYKKVTDNEGNLVGAWKESGGTVTFKNLKADDGEESTGASLKVTSSDAIGNPKTTDTAYQAVTENLATGMGDTIQNAIDSISNRRVALGGSLAAMDSISSYLSSMTTANEAAYTAVTEANIAKEMTSYVKNNVYSQAAQAMISQANQSLAQVLNLLQ